MHKRPLKKLLCAITAAIGLSASLSASATDPLKVGFVYIGPIGDHGWTYQHEQGRKALAENSVRRSPPTTWRTSPKVPTPNG